MRLNHDPLERQFAHWLLKLGYGSTVDMNTSSGSIAILRNMVCTDQDNLIQSLYGRNHQESTPPPQYFYDRVLLAPLNNNIQKLNTHILQLFPGLVCRYISADTQIVEPGTQHSANQVLVEF